MKTTSKILSTVDDPRLTQEVKRKTFRTCEKDYLYGHLRENHPSTKKMDELMIKISQYVKSLIMDYVYDRDLVKILPNLSTRLYRRVYNSTLLTPSLGFDEKEDLKVTRKDTNDKERSFSLPIRLSIRFSEDDHMIFHDFLNNEEKLSNILVKKCPKEKILALKNMINDYYEQYIEKHMYLIEWKNPSHWSGPRGFTSISSWGALYKINRDWFDIVYDNYEYEVSKTETGENKTSEDKIKELEKIFELK